MWLLIMSLQASGAFAVWPYKSWKTGVVGYALCAVCCYIAQTQLGEVSP